MARHFSKVMDNYKEILKKVIERVDAYLKSGGDLEEDLWPSGRDVILEIKQLIKLADPPIDKE